VKKNDAIRVLAFVAAGLALCVPACGSDDSTTTDPGVGGGGGDAALEGGEGGPGGTEGGIGGGGTGGKGGSAGDAGPEASAGSAGDAAVDVVTEDVVEDADAGPLPPTYANAYSFTSGGGVGTSSTYKLWISTGASQPYGTGKTSKYIVSVGAPKPLR
jgi:hypothetical protein